MFSMFLTGCERSTRGMAERAQSNTSASTRACSAAAARRQGGRGAEGRGHLTKSEITDSVCAGDLVGKRGEPMARNTKHTSRRVASVASKILRDSRSTKAEKTVAASDLAQTRKK